MGILDNKKAIIFGVANERSIAWAIAQALQREGAELAFTYAGAVLESRVRPLAESIGSKLILPCDATNDAEIDAVFENIKSQWGGLDILIHSIAFANKEELKGMFVDTSRDGFKLAMDVSAYSLVALAKRAYPLMTNGGSIITMTYYGSEKVVPNYNVMGVAKAALEASVKYLAADLGQKNIRVNAISAGPIKTLAAMGISGFRDMLQVVEGKAPLKRNVTTEDVANTAVYLAGSLSSGVTGEIIYVDAGYNIVGM
ncbi:MAG: enoyl-ACP reductase FabI [Deltaproteobacteria bacterium]|nr:enoyl-ACP reductase FabI [Deltaproteobacteria bacterium]